VLSVPVRGFRAFNASYRAARFPRAHRAGRSIVVLGGNPSGCKFRLLHARLRVRLLCSAPVLCRAGNEVRQLESFHLGFGPLSRLLRRHGGMNTEGKTPPASSELVYFSACRQHAQTEPVHLLVPDEIFMASNFGVSHARLRQDGA